MRRSGSGARNWSILPMCLSASGSSAPWRTAAPSAKKMKWIFAASARSVSPRQKVEVERCVARRRWVAPAGGVRPRWRSRSVRALGLFSCS